MWRGRPCASSFSFEKCGRARAGFRHFHCNRGWRGTTLPGRTLRPCTAHRTKSCSHRGLRRRHRRNHGCKTRHRLPDFPPLPVTHRSRLACRSPRELLRELPRELPGTTALRPPRKIIWIANELSVSRSGNSHRWLACNRTPVLRAYSRRMVVSERSFDCDSATLSKSNRAEPMFAP